MIDNGSLLWWKTSRFRKTSIDDTDEMRNSRILRTAAFLSIIGMFIISWASVVGAEEPSEPQVKAAFVYNFTKFVQWPNHILPPGEPQLSLCVLGNDHLADTLDSLKGKTTSGRQLSVRRIAGPEDAGRCHIVYIGRSERDQARNILKGMKSGILTIGDMPQFASSGGIINFVIVESRVSFEVNVDAAEKAGLRISSQLLKLAQIVKEGGR
jgi:hypothetical protein